MIYYTIEFGKAYQIIGAIKKSLKNQTLRKTTETIIEKIRKCKTY